MKGNNIESHGRMNENSMFCKIMQVERNAVGHPQRLDHGAPLLPSRTWPSSYEQGVSIEKEHHGCLDRTASGGDR